MEEEKKAAAAELKKELQRAVESLAEEDEDDYSLEATDQAIKTLFALTNELDLDNKEVDHGMKKIFQDYCSSSSAGELVEGRGTPPPPPPPPHGFTCPISGTLMEDPVVIASGQTCDKQCIQDWFNDGHQKCPRTGETLSHTLLTPNNSIKKMILKWCELNSIQIPITLLTTVVEECKAETANQEYLVTLLGKLISLLSDAEGAAKELRMLANRFPSVRALFGGASDDTIPQLFSEFLLQFSGFYEDFRENLVATILSISVHENNRNKLLEDIPSVISFLVKCLSDERIETKIQAAATVCVLSEVDSNRHIIGNSGAIKHLIEIIAEGPQLALKDAASAVFWLCALDENRERAVSEGAVPEITGKIIDRVQLDEMLGILTILCRRQRAIDEMDEHGGIHVLFSLLTEKNISEQLKEVCVAILYTICVSDEMKVESIRRVSNAHEILSQIARTGTSRAMRKANVILKRLRSDIASTSA